MSPAPWRVSRLATGPHLETVFQSLLSELSGRYTRYLPRKSRRTRQKGDYSGAVPQMQTRESCKRTMV
jgi:hypothetical protein